MDIVLTLRLQCPLVTWLQWEAIPLTVSDAVDKGWILQDECNGEFKMQHKQFRSCKETLGYTSPVRKLV